MKKTMLKRSLALGALMVFAITGSALAADVIDDSDKSITDAEVVANRVRAVNGNTITFNSAGNVNVDFSANETVNAPAYMATNNGTINFGTADKPLQSLKVEANKNILESESDYAYWTGYIYNGGTININAATYEQSGSGHGIYVIGNDEGGGATLNINVTDFISNTAYTALHVREGHNAKVVVNATNFEANATADDTGVAVLQANEGGSIEINAENVVLTGTKKIGGGVIGSGSVGTITINANDVKLTGNINGVYGGKVETGETASFNINANTLNLDGDINVGSRGEYQNGAVSNFTRNTEVNLHVNDTAYINGDIVVMGNSGNNSKNSDYSLVNITFDGDSVIDGDIIVKGSEITQDATINLGGTGDMTASKGAYQVTKGGNLNFTGGTWAVNDWQGEDGDLGVGEGATLEINDNITVATASLDDGSTVVIDAENDKFQDAPVITAGTANVDKGATVQVNNVDTNTALKVFDDNAVNKQLVENDNVKSDNMMQTFTLDESGNIIVVTADAAEVLPGVILSNIITNLTENNIKNDFFDTVLKSGDSAQATKALNNAATMSELAGVSHATYSASNILTDAVADHMSLARSLDHDTDIWAHYVHNKENIDGLATAGGGARYDAQYNGIVVGADLYKHGKGTIGAALTYIDGKITGNTKNDAEYYGVSVYGGIQNEDSAIIGDISYLHGKNDITQYNSSYKLTGEPKSDAFSVGVRAEQSFKAGAGKVVPYAGLRYMHLGTGNYTNSIGLSYDADDANLFLLPVGVKYSAEHKTAGWILRPIVEVGYVWAMGDRDGQQTVSLNGASNGFGYDVTDSGSYIGRFAVEAEKANVTYGLAYEYQKGDSVKANKWMANLNWAF